MSGKVGALLTLDGAVAVAEMGSGALLTLDGTVFAEIGSAICLVGGCGTEIAGVIIGVDTFADCIGSISAGADCSGGEWLPPPT